MDCCSAAYDVGKPPKSGTHRANARLSNLAHLKCRGGWEDSILPPPPVRKSLKVRDVSDAQCLLVQRRAQGALTPVKDGSYAYAVSPKGNLYIDHRRAYGTHAAMMGFRPVQAAGWVTVAKHRIVCIDSTSGHYQPTDAQFLQTAADLQEAGMLGPDVCLLGWEAIGLKRHSLGGAEKPRPGAMRSLTRSDTPDEVFVSEKTVLGSLQLAPYAVAFVCKNLLSVVTGRGGAPGWWLRAAISAKLTWMEHIDYMRAADSHTTRT